VAFNQLWYAYAKTLAEKSAWQMAKESGLDLVVVNPSFVVGPLLGPQPTSTLLLVLGIIKGKSSIVLLDICVTQTFSKYHEPTSNTQDSSKKYERLKLYLKLNLQRFPKVAKSGT